MKDVPKELDVIAGAVLRYRPKPKTKAERRKIRRDKRKRVATRPKRKPRA